MPRPPATQPQPHMLPITKLGTEKQKCQFPHNSQRKTLESLVAGSLVPCPPILPLTTIKRLSFNTKAKCFAGVLPGICDKNNRHRLTIDYFIRKAKGQRCVGGWGGGRLCTSEGSVPV